MRAHLEKSLYVAVGRARIVYEWPTEALTTASGRSVINPN